MKKFSVNITTNNNSFFYIKKKTAHNEKNINSMTTLCSIYSTESYSAVPLSTVNN